jgi:hypothetical protein
MHNMLDGAPSIGELEGVTWLTPAAVFEIKLRIAIAEMLKPVVTIWKSDLKRAARAAKNEVNMEFSRDPVAGRNLPPRTERPEWLKTRTPDQFARRTTPHRSE